MGSVPLAALHINPPEQQPDPINRFAALMQLKQQQALMPGQLQAQRQHIQAGALENQEKAQQLKDQQALTAAYQKWDGKNPDDLGKLVTENGGSGNARIGVQKQFLALREQYSTIAKNDAETGSKNLETLKGKNDLVLGALKTADSVPDEQLGQHLAETVQGLTQQGVLDPQHAQQAAQLIQGLQGGTIQPAQARQALSIFEKSLQSNSQQIDQAAKEATAAKDKSIAERNDIENQAMKKFGGMTPAMAESRYLSVQSKMNQGFPVSPDDKAFVKAYEKNKTLNPVATFNLQNQGVNVGSPQTQSLMQAVADGRMKIQDVLTYRTPLAERQAFLNGVLAINPQYKSSDYDIEKGVSKAFTTGKPAEELVAFNTAISHADLLKKAAEALNNGDVRALNSAGNSLGVQFGSDKATNFKVIADAYTREVNKALTAGHVTDSEIKEIGSTIPANASPAQIAGALDSYKKLMQSKVEQRKAQYEAGSKAKPNFGGAPPAPSGMITVQIPGHPPGHIPASAKAQFLKDHPDAQVTQ